MLETMRRTLDPRARERRNRRVALLVVAALLASFLVPVAVILLEQVG